MAPDQESFVFVYSALGFGANDCYFIAFVSQSNLDLDSQKWSNTAAPYEWFIQKGERMLFFEAAVQRLLDKGYPVHKIDTDNKLFLLSL